MKRALLLTGKPGTGKTALIKEALARTKVKGGGFYTEEIRTGGIRQGFKIVTLDGQEAILAHVGISSPYQVSKYRVDTDSLNRVGVSALRQALKETDLIVIDEIGKMECLSRVFVEAVERLLNGPVHVLATIAMKGGGLIARAKVRPPVEVLHVSAGNRNELPDVVAARLPFRCDRYNQRILCRVVF